MYVDLGEVKYASQGSEHTHSNLMVFGLLFHTFSHLTFSTAAAAAAASYHELFNAFDM